MRLPVCRLSLVPPSAAASTGQMKGGETGPAPGRESERGEQGQRQAERGGDSTGWEEEQVGQERLAQKEKKKGREVGKKTGSDGWRRDAGPGRRWPSLRVLPLAPLWPRAEGGPREVPVSPAGTERCHRRSCCGSGRVCRLPWCPGTAAGGAAGGWARRAWTSAPGSWVPSPLLAGRRSEGGRGGGQTCVSTEWATTRPQLRVLWFHRQPTFPWASFSCFSAAACLTLASCTILWASCHHGDGNIEREEQNFRHLSSSKPFYLYYFWALSSIWSFHWLLIFGKVEGGQLDEPLRHGTEIKAEGFDADPDWKHLPQRDWPSAPPAPAPTGCGPAPDAHTRCPSVSVPKIWKGRTSHSAKILTCASIFLLFVLFFLHAQTLTRQHKVNVTTPSLQRPAALGESPSPSLWFLFPCPPGKSCDAGRGRHGLGLQGRDRLGRRPPVRPVSDDPGLPHWAQSQPESEEAKRCTFAFTTNKYLGQRWLLCCLSTITSLLHVVSHWYLGSWPSVSDSSKL